MVGEPLRDIAKRYEGVSKDGLHRHREHLSPALARVVQQRADAGPVTALDKVDDLYLRASRVLDAAESDGKGSLTLAAIRELRALTELLAKITGELDERSQVNVLNLSTSEDWLQVRAAILQELGRFPDARTAVVGRLQAIEA